MSIQVRVSQCFAVLAPLFLCSAPADAATVNAASCASSAVQSAINSAATGDTVAVPAGKCTWSTTVTVPDSKKIVIQGAGMSATVITRSAGDFYSPNVAFDLNRSGARITAFGFVNTAIEVDGDDWRIDHNQFDHTEKANTILVRGTRETMHPRGLIDSNIFSNSRIDVVGWTGLLSHALWAQPLALGGAQTVFIEDNTFEGNEFTNNADGSYGGRYVFRHNTVIDGHIEVHSVQGANRSMRSFEIYDNTFRLENQEKWVPFFIRGGTGVIYNNTLTGDYSSPVIMMDNVRTEDNVAPWGFCDGSKPVDGNQESNGYPCRDQIGRSTDAFLWTGGTNCPSQGCPAQALDPAYFWNNRINGSALGTEVQSPSGTHIKANRDFINNTPKPGYTPYTYPHPLRTGTTPVPPLPPSNLRITTTN